MIWKYWIVCHIIPLLPGMIGLHFIPELLRLKNTPTEIEKNEELDKIAGNALEALKDKKS